MFTSSALVRYKNFRVILSCLLAVLYLGVFFAHDLVFLQTDFTRHSKESNLESTCRIKLSPGGSEIEHNCPFCAGFIDSQVEVELSPAFACPLRLRFSRMISSNSSCTHAI